MQMKYYDILFRMIYELIESIQAGYTNQTDYSRGLASIYILSILEGLNIVTIAPSLGKLYVVVLIIGMVFGNYMLFLYKGRFKRIIGYKLKINEKLFSVVYIVATIVALGTSKVLGYS